MPWSLLQFTGQTGAPPWEMFDKFLKDSHLKHLEPVLAAREWLAGPFSIADILMADVLRLVDRFAGLATSPPASASADARPPARLPDVRYVTLRLLDNRGA